MTAPAFTPGPYYLTGDDDRRYVREEASDACLALLIDGGHVDPKCALPEAEIAANAALFVAAPSLYHTLSALRRLVADIPAVQSNPRFAEANQRALRVLSQARGE